MKKILFLLILLPLLGEGCLFAQNVTVKNLVVTEGSPSTVTFDVSWDKPALGTVWMDSAWVFVDYNKNGRMARLPLLLSSGATLTATSAPGEGKLNEVSGNTKGAWVAGYARYAGSESFSATVMLLSDEEHIAGACAYASGYPPVGEYLDDTKLQFTGTPMYKIWLNSASGPEMVESGSTFFIPCGYTIESFTDSTGAPGIFKCIRPAIYTLSGADVCEGAAVTLTLSGSQSEFQYQLYNGDATVGSPVPGTGTPLTFNGETAVGGYTYTVRTVSGAGVRCDMTMSNVLHVTVNPLPVAPTSPSADARCGSGTVTFSASVPGDCTIDWYTTMDETTLVSGGGSVTSFSLSIGSSTTYYAQARNTTTGCVSATRTPVTGTVNPVPAVPTMGGNGNAYCGSGTITATFGSNGNGIRWTDGNGSNTVSPRTVNASDTYYAVATSAAGCESSTMSVSVTIKPVPAITPVSGSGPANQIVDQNTAITAMTYTATNSAVISMSGNFPAGITGTPSGSSYTISGTPTAVGTFGYSLTATAANGCISTAGGAFTVNIACPTSIPTTLCPQCAWDGAAWVDCCVTSHIYPFDGTPYIVQRWSALNDATFYSGASGPGSDKNGRANTAAISSTYYYSAVQICKNLGTGWYLPAYEELVNMGRGIGISPLNNRPAFNMLGPNDDCWSSTETYGNGGRFSIDSEEYKEQAVTVWVSSDMRSRTKTSGGIYNVVRCVWRP
jgi:hypothetical protein